MYLTEITASLPLIRRPALAGSIAIRRAARQPPLASGGTPHTLAA
jgi:hypothetical protein